MAVLCGVFQGCDPQGLEPEQPSGADTLSTEFSVKVKEASSSYVDLEFFGPDSVEVAYVLSTEEIKYENKTILYKDGEKLTVSGGDVVRLTNGIKDDTQFYLYLIAVFGPRDFSDIFTLEFKTATFNFDELITILDRDYAGYRARLTLPQSTKDAKNAIRWSQCDIMMYNYMASDDYSSLLYNGGSVANAATRDTTLVYTEESNWYQTGQDSDADGEIDWENRFNPISPGEPVVFIAGEFSWMEDTPEYKNDYFMFPAGWANGYYLPVLDPQKFFSSLGQQNVGVIDDLDLSRPEDAAWTGAFQRKLFRVQEPEPFDGKVNVSVIEASPIDISFAFEPDDNVVQYAVGIFDDAMYQQVLDLVNGREEYLQWAITSYFAAYTLGTIVQEGAVQINLTSIYYQDAIAEDSDYHILVTAMGDNMATTQNFQEYVFSTTKRVKTQPVIEVTAVESETTAYEAVFNVKCTTAAEGNPVTECYYAANYLRDWLLTINSGSTYFSIVSGNKAYSYFTADEVEQINSPEGLKVSIPSLDGETTRFVALGYNDEYSPNDLTGFKYIEDCPAVADCTTPYTDPKPYVNPDTYRDLADVWTATATLSNSEGTKLFKHTSKITLAADLYDYPETLSQDVYDLYEKSKFDKDQVDAFWREFKALAKEITEERLEYQNRLVGIGWLDKDSYERLSARTPYELFIAKDYSSVDVSSLYHDFGPKWYLETSKDKDGNIVYSIPFDQNFLPPASNWSAPFYLMGLEPETYTAVSYGDGWTPSFPVTVSADRNTITIGAFVYNDVKYFPNMIGLDSSTGGTLLENPVVSEVVLTRGWKETPKEQSSFGVSGRNVQVDATFPDVVYKQRTRITAQPELKKIEKKMVTVDQFKTRADQLVNRIIKSNN